MTTNLPASDDAGGSHHPPLNYYGELARQWEGCLPEIYQQIRDSGAFFAVIGEVIAHRIDELTDHLAGNDQHGEGYLAKVARLTAAREHAQRRVLDEYLLLPPEPDSGSSQRVNDEDDEEPTSDEDWPVIVVIGRSPGGAYLAGSGCRRGRPPGAVVRAWCPKRSQGGRPDEQG